MSPVATPRSDAIRCYRRVEEKKKIFQFHHSSCLLTSWKLSMSSLHWFSIIISLLSLALVMKMTRTSSPLSSSMWDVFLERKMKPDQDEEKNLIVVDFSSNILRLFNFKASRNGWKKVFALKLMMISRLFLHSSASLLNQGIRNWIIWKSALWKPEIESTFIEKKKDEQKKTWQMNLHVVFNWRRRKRDQLAHVLNFILLIFISNVQQSTSEPNKICKWPPRQLMCNL